MTGSEEAALRQELDDLSRQQEKLIHRKPVYRNNNFRSENGVKTYRKTEFSTRNYVSRKRMNQNSHDDLRESGRDSTKKRRLLSAILDPTNSKDTNSPRATDTRDSKDSISRTNSQSEDKPSTPRLHASKEGTQRNRRMFGALMGHLGKAKQLLEKDSSLFKRQGSVEAAVNKKEQDERKRLQVLDAEKKKNMKRKEEELRDEITTKQTVAQLKLKHIQWIKKQQHTKEFIQTVSHPPLFYRPNKLTEKFEDLLAASVESLEEVIQLKQRELDTKISDLELAYKDRKAQREQEREDAEMADATGEQSQEAEKEENLEEEDEEKDKNSEDSKNDTKESGEKDFLVDEDDHYKTEEPAEGTTMDTANEAQPVSTDIKAAKEVADGNSCKESAIDKKANTIEKSDGPTDDKIKEDSEKSNAAEEEESKKDSKVSDEEQEKTKAPKKKVGRKRKSTAASPKKARVATPTRRSKRNK